MIMLMVLGLLGLLHLDTKGVLGQRLLSRLFDTFGGIIFIACATAWLLVVFPLNLHILQTCYGFPQILGAVDF
jgi:hypothetical protein